MEFILTDKVTTKNHTVRVTAVYDGKNPPKAVAELSGFGDSLHRGEVFDAKKLTDALTAVEQARDTVDAVQAVADRWHGELNAEGVQR